MDLYPWLDDVWVEWPAESTADTEEHVVAEYGWGTWLILSGEPGTLPRSTR